MTFRDRLEFKRLQDENAALRRKLAQSDKSLTRTMAQLSDARRARAPKIMPLAPRRKLKGDIVRVVACDVHGARMDTAAVAQFIGELKRIQPNEIFLLGDIVDCGGFLAQHHTLGYVAEIAYSYEDDIRAANAFLDQLQQACPNALIIYVEGNHESRIERWSVSQALKGGSPKDADFLRRQNGPEFLLRLAERGIRYYRMSECHDGLPVRGTIKRGKIFYTHGSFLVGKDAARKAVEKFSGNVVFANTHRADSHVGSRPNVGVIGGFNPGCLCQKRPLYMNTNPDDWTHGYGLEFIAPSQNFLHVQVPLVGESLVVPLLGFDSDPKPKST